ncbi:MAG: nuclear transport factor 2 family protein, partial [Acinetobacter sp.]
MMKRITTLAVSAITILSLSACKSMPAYTSDYTKAREQVNGVVMDDQKAMDIGQRFVGAFNTL